MFWTILSRYSMTGGGVLLAVSLCGCGSKQYSDGSTTAERATTTSAVAVNDTIATDTVQRDTTAGGYAGRQGVMSGGRSGGPAGHGRMGSGTTGSGMMGGRGVMGGAGMMGTGSMMATSDTSATPRPKAVSSAAAAGCPAVNQNLVNRGRTVFGSTGNCYACHGAAAKGTPLAPDLTDKQWLNINGSYASIAQLVRSGVARPKQHAAPMPPMGGASLTPQQVCAAAAYVYSLGH